MKRSRLFNQAFKLMFGPGAGGMWAVALAVTAVNLLVSLINPVTGTFGSILMALIGAATGAFLSGALIHTASALVDGQPQTLGGSFRAGDRSFVTLLQVGLLLALPAWLVSEGLGLILGLLPQGTSGDTASQASILLLCCATPVLLALEAALFFTVDTLGVGTERAVVLEGLGVLPAFRRAAGLLRARLRDFIVIELLMALIGLGMTIFASCPLILLSVGASLAASEPGGTLQAALSPDTAGYLSWLAAIIFPLRIFFSIVWTLAFRAWQDKEAAERSVI